MIIFLTTSFLIQFFTSLTLSYFDVKDLISQSIAAVGIEAILVIVLGQLFQLKLLIQHKDVIDNYIKLIDFDELDDYGTHKLARNKFNELNIELDNIFSGISGKLFQEDTMEVYKSLFRKGENYNGMIQDTPSNYINYYKSYVEEQLKNKKVSDKRITKIVITSEKMLKVDYIANKNAYKDFVKSHNYGPHRDKSKPSIDLKFIELKEANMISNYNLLKNVGIWDKQFSIQIDKDYTNDGKFKLIFSRANSSDKEEQQEYKECEKYYGKLNKKASDFPISFTSKELNEVELGKDTKNHVTEELANIWDLYADTDIRKEKEEKFFKSIFGKQLEDGMKILIMYANTGILSFNLKDPKHEILSLESDSEFNKILQEKFNQHNISTGRREFRKLPIQSGFVFEELKAGKRVFDAIFILDNCYVFETTDRRKEILVNCYDVLRKGGALIIDQRNCEKIEEFLNQEPENFNNPKKFYEECYKNETLFCGEQIIGWPKEFEDGELTFAYGKDIETIYGTFKFKFISKEQIPNDLKKAQFSLVHTYQDYINNNQVKQEEEVNKTKQEEGSKLENKEKPDFFVHVAYKH